MYDKFQEISTSVRNFMVVAVLADPSNYSCDLDF